MTISLKLEVEGAEAPLAVPTSTPRISWRVTDAGPDAQQRAARVRVVAAKSATEVYCGAVNGTQTHVDVSDPLASDSDFSVYVDTDYTDGSSVSATTRFGTSLLHGDDWVGSWIEPQQEEVAVDGAARFELMFSLPAPADDRERMHPPIRVRQAIDLDASVTRARLYATAAGVYRAEINGSRVGDEELAPGYDTYAHHVFFQAYDVTDLLHAGPNVVGIELADGWYAGRAGMLGASREYGDRLRARWQLHVELSDGSTRVLGSDESARSDRGGPIRYSDIAIGEYFDARLADAAWSTASYDDSTWATVRSVSGAGAEATDFIGRMEPFVGEPIRVVREVAAVEILRTPSGDLIVDFGQVLVGRVRFTLSGPAGAVLRLDHTEILGTDGEYFQNLVGPNKDQSDVYVFAGTPGGETWEPTHTFHGFRFVRLAGDVPDVTADAFTAVVLSSDFAVTGEFRSSDAALNRLAENVMWSFRSNFLSVPTDCPTRERWGWTGDAQVFTPTAAKLGRVERFLGRWLMNVRADQKDSGAVPNIVPWPPVLDYIFSEPPASYDDEPMVIATSAGWGDAVVRVPWDLYQHFGDVRVLDENYEAMTAWVRHQRHEAAAFLPWRLRDVTLDEERARRQSYLWNGVAHFGDWLAPSTLERDPHDQMAAPRQTGELVGAMYHGASAALLAEIATVLGREDDAREWSEHAERVRAAFVAEYLDEDGRFSSDLQGIAVIALAFGFVPGDFVGPTVERLVESIRTRGMRLDTGFLSVPFILDVLTTHGHPDVAMALVRQTEFPSWLYEVERGATTIWETWGAIQPDGTVTRDSYNHYAFGSVLDWMLRRLGGVAPAAAGFREAKIAPLLACGLDSASSTIDTPFGPLGSSWQRRGDEFRLEMIVPTGVATTVDLGVDAVDLRWDDGRPIESSPFTAMSGVSVIHGRLRM